MQYRRLTRAADFVTADLLNPCRSTTLVYIDVNLAHRTGNSPATFSVQEGKHPHTSRSPGDSDGSTDKPSDLL